MASEELLRVTDLKTYFSTESGVTKSVDGVSFSIRQGETLGVVGESGCGKSVTSLSIMGLVPKPPGIIAGGEIWFENRNLLELSEREMRDVRGNEIGMIFQEPMTSLNPVFTIGDQVGEPLRLHRGMNKRQALHQAVELLREVGIPRAEQIVQDYPHRLSGGMRQRVMIATAMACNPKLLIADEPTTALDVTIQAQILDLMRKLKGEFNTSIMLITHDLGVVAEMCERVVVMYAGRVVEEADVIDLFAKPKHPYTMGLMESIPRLDLERKRLNSIQGTVPSPSEMPAGCKFAPRCPFATSLCYDKEPGLVVVESGHSTRCWLHQPAMDAGDESRRPHIDNRTQVFEPTASERYV